MLRSLSSVFPSLIPPWQSSSLFSNICELTSAHQVIPSHVTDVSISLLRIFNISVKKLLVLCGLSLLIFYKWIFAIHQIGDYSIFMTWGAWMFRKLLRPGIFVFKVQQFLCFCSSLSVKLCTIFSCTLGENSSFWISEWLSSLVCEHSIFLFSLSNEVNIFTSPNRVSSFFSEHNRVSIMFES